MRGTIAFVVAGVIALLLIIAGVVYVQLARRQFVALAESAKQELLEQKAASELPAEWARTDIENLQPSDLDFEVPENLVARVRIANMLASFWYAWVALVLTACLGIAAWASRSSQA